MSKRPPWHRHARAIGSSAWVPYEVAAGLQEEVDGQAARLAALGQELTRAHQLLSHAAEQPRPQPQPQPQAVGDDSDERVKAAEEKVVRLGADLANLRRHKQQEIDRARLQERVARLQGLADVHDDLVRARDNNPDHESPWYQGHVAILHRVLAEMKRAGASPVGKAGDAFDPRLHEAVGAVPTDAADPDTVLAVQQLGFVLEDGTLVRPAMVVVARPAG